MISRKIRAAMAYKAVTVTELVNRLGCTTGNVTNKLRRDNFTVRDLQKIADALDMKLIVDFVLVD